VTYRKLVYWTRECPRCGTAFESVQELGRCPGCDHLFKADSLGVAYVVEKDHPVLGTMESCRARDNDEIGAREWSLKKYERKDYPERYIRIVGDSSGPRAQSLDVIVDLAEHGDEIERSVIDAVRTDRQAFPFASDDFEFDSFEMFFFDVEDSSRYSAHLLYYIPHGSQTSYGEWTECHGDGEFEIVFEMRGREIVRRFPPSDDYDGLGCGFSGLKGILLSLIGAAVLYGVIRLID
jgi:hypothetical protein